MRIFGVILIKYLSVNFVRPGKRFCSAQKERLFANMYLEKEIEHDRLVRNWSKEWIMETVGAYEAKTHLPKLLERVSKGECITITKHGIPIAVLQPHDSQKTVDTKSVISELRKFRKKHSLGGLSIREMIEEGRK